MFHLRLKSEADSKPGPPLILPIIWQPPRSIAYVAERLQFSHGDFGAKYAQLGLKQLMRLRSLKDHYYSFVRSFAERVVQVVEHHPLAEAPDSIPRLESAPNAFAISHPLATRPLAQPLGCSSVRFIIVAGTRHEIEGVCDAERRDCYGDCCTAWRPFSPEYCRSIGPVVEEVASQEDLVSASVCAVGDTTGMMVVHGDAGSSLIDTLKRWRDENVIVVFVVDPWTIRLSDYHQLLRQFDEYSLPNCDLLVAWNNKDAETSRCFHELMHALEITFQNRIVSSGEWERWDKLRSVDAFKKELRERLMRLRGRIIKLQDVKRRARGSVLIQKPMISGPAQLSDVK